MKTGREGGKHPAHLPQARANHDAAAHHSCPATPHLGVRDVQGWDGLHAQGGRMLRRKLLGIVRTWRGGGAPPR